MLNGPSTWSLGEKLYFQGQINLTFLFDVYYKYIGGHWLSEETIKAL